MAAFLFILCILSFVSGIMSFTMFQQIVSVTAFVTAAILLIGAAIVNSIDKLTLEMRKVKKTL